MDNRRTPESDARATGVSGRVPDEARADQIGVLVALAVEMVRQDVIHPDGYPPTRDGIRLAIAAADDELIETLAAWRAARCKCPKPRCGHHDWTEVGVEAIQTAAVLMRMVRALPQPSAGGESS